MGKNDKTRGIKIESEYMISEILTQYIILIKFSKKKKLILNKIKVIEKSPNRKPYVRKTDKY